MLGAYRQALGSHDFVNRSEWALKECHDYVFLGNGSVAHEGAANPEDPSGANENHGDRVIADALCAYVMKDYLPVEEEVEAELPAGSVASRRARRLQTANKRDWW